MKKDIKSSQDLRSKNHRLLQQKHNHISSLETSLQVKDEELYKMRVQLDFVYAISLQKGMDLGNLDPQLQSCQQYHTQQDPQSPTMNSHQGMSQTNRHIQAAFSQAEIPLSNRFSSLTDEYAQEDQDPQYTLTKNQPSLDVEDTTIIDVPKEPLRQGSTYQHSGAMPKRRAPTSNNNIHVPSLGTGLQTHQPRQRNGFNSRKHTHPGQNERRPQLEADTDLNAKKASQTQTRNGNTWNHTTTTSPTEEVQAQPEWVSYASIVKNPTSVPHTYTENNRRAQQPLRPSYQPNITPQHTYPQSNSSISSPIQKAPHLSPRRRHGTTNPNPNHQMAQPEPTTPLELSNPQSYTLDFRPGRASVSTHKALLEQAYQTLVATLDLLALPLALTDPTTQLAIKNHHSQILQLTQKSLDYLNQQ